MNISGVILVIIVLLWGSLLVPALIRKHDSVTEVRSVDRFSYALRILSRRTPYLPGRRDVVVPRKSARDRRPVTSPAPGFVAVGSEAFTAAARASAARAALAHKRRRSLLGLVLAIALCAVMAYSSGGRWFLALGISAVIFVMYVTHLRTEAQQLAQIERRRAQARRQVGRGAMAQAGARIARPDRSAPAAAAAALPDAVPAAVPSAVAAAVSSLPPGSWSPVQVTLPTYVSKPVVSRPPVAPPTGGWYDGVEAEEQAARFAAAGDVYDQTAYDQTAYDQMSDDDGYLGLSDGLGATRDSTALYGLDGLDGIIERRRVVND